VNTLKLGPALEVIERTWTIYQ